MAQKRKREDSEDKEQNKRIKKEDKQFFPFPEDQREDFLDVEWMTSHILPDKVLWSSDPSKIKPSIGTFFQESGNNVVNTWFVESPTLSSANLQSWEKELDVATNFLMNAECILIVAGAGMGVDSGLPDYRGPQGFWNAYPLLKDKGLSLEEMSHPDWFDNDPKAAWGFYSHRAELYRNSLPHEGFRVLRDLVSLKKEYFIFTSNIDSQFQAAGFDTNKIYEAHGSLDYLQCVNEDCEEVWKGDASEIPKSDEKLTATTKLPLCPECESLARPNVSMFGDTTSTWKDSRSIKQKKTFLKWLKNECGLLKENQKKKQLTIIEIGCGTSLHSLRLEVELLLDAANTENNINCIRINPHAYEIRHSGCVGLGLGSKEALVEIERRLQEAMMKKAEI